MNKVLLVVLGLLMTPGAALAQDPVAKPIEPIPPGEDRIELLLEGKAAPFTGQLFDNDTAMRWANWLVQYKYRLALDVQEQQALCAVRTDALKKELLVEQEKYDKVADAYDQKLAEMTAAAEPAWYETPWIGFVSGVVLTTAAAGVIVWAANSGD